MNNKGNTATVVNISDIIWDLLSQWKMMLIVAIIMAILITGSKYQMDIKLYESAVASKSGDMVSKSLSVEDHTKEVLKTLPEDERAMVEYMVKQREWLEKEKNYINNSIMMNTDPTNQRTLLLYYYISTEENDSSQREALAYEYSAYVYNDAIIERLSQVIAPDADKKYIEELIDVEDLNNVNKDSSKTINDNDAVIGMKIVLPDDTDEKAVEGIISEALGGYSSELEKNIGPHSFSLLSAHVARLYNEKAVNSKNNIINSAYNISFTFLKNSEALLSDRQRAALSAITSYKQASDGSSDSFDETQAEIVKPTISKKYGLMGFVLGGMLYALTYILYSIIRGRINSAKQISNYLSGRLIGEVYYRREYNGFSKLLHSRWVDNARYGNKLDKSKQIAKVISSIRMIWNHYDDNDMTLFTLVNDKGGNVEIEDIINQIKQEGIDIDIRDVTCETDDSVIENTKKAICLIEKERKVVDVVGFNSLMESFDIKQIGYIFVGEI